MYRTQLVDYASYKEATDPAVSTNRAGSADSAIRLTDLSSHKPAR